MKLFLDSADLADISPLATTGLLDGVTTDFSMLARTGKNQHDAIGEICALVDGPVGAPVASASSDRMAHDARALRELGHNVMITLPPTPDGLRVCRELSEDGVMTNITLCFTAAQALLAAKAGATFVSLFPGQLDEIAASGLQLIADTLLIYRTYPALGTEVLVSGLTSAVQVVEAAKLGAHGATLPAGLLRGLYLHPLTQSGLAAASSAAIHA